MQPLIHKYYMMFELLIVSLWPFTNCVTVSNYRCSSYFWSNGYVIKVLLEITIDNNRGFIRLLLYLGFFTRKMTGRKQSWQCLFLCLLSLHFRQQFSGNSDSHSVLWFPVSSACSIFVTVLRVASSLVTNSERVDVFFPLFFCTWKFAGFFCLQPSTDNVICWRNVNGIVKSQT